MSKARKDQIAKPRPSSAVDPVMLAQYRCAARAPTMREEIRALMLLVDDYQALLAAGDLRRALGAGLQLVDLGLRIPATPSPNAAQRQCKAGFFERHFGSLVSSFSHSHVARLANAAVAVEQALATGEARARH